MIIASQKWSSLNTTNAFSTQEETRQSPNCVKHISFLPFAQQLLHNCITCKKLYALPYRDPNMPDLPRLELIGRPFQKTGLDYLGPLKTYDDTNSVPKVWVCLFTCMATRDAHLEVIRNNSTEEFHLLSVDLLGIVVCRTPLSATTPPHSQLRTISFRA